MDTARYLGRLFATNLAAAYALRGAFWLQVAMMAINNLMFFCFWWILFDRYPVVEGWSVAGLAQLFGVAAMAYGLCAVLLGGLAELARQIDDGELDPLLVQPRSVLLQAIASKTRPDGWGDLATGLGLVIAYGDLGAPGGGVRLVVLPLAVLLGAITLASCNIVYHATAFWLGRTQTTARFFSELVLTFAMYPAGIFAAPMRAILFVVVPAGFVSHVPAQLVLQPELGTLLVATAGAAAWAAAAWGVFERGLRRYSGSSRFGVRG
jgi:ABC-2 type transport system permease protein